MRVSMDKLIGTGLFLLLILMTISRKRVIWPRLCLLLVIVASFEPGMDYGVRLLSAATGFVPLFIVTGSWTEALLPGALGYVLPFRFKSEELTEIYRSVPRFPGLSFRLRISISFAVSGRSHPARPTVVVRRSPWLRFRHSEGVH